MKAKLFTILAVVMLFGACPVRAALITIEIEAVVDSVEDQGNYLEGQINPGDTITGFYIYESTTPDSSPLVTLGRYEHSTPPHGIFLSVGGFDFETDPANVDFVLGIVNDGTSGDDSYWLISYNNLPLPNGTLVDQISWQLDDPTGNALSTTELPTTAPVLEDWQSIYGLHLEGVKDTFHVVAEVTSAIPETTTLFLLGIGGLLLRKRR